MALTGSVKLVHTASQSTTKKMACIYEMKMSKHILLPLILEVQNKYRCCLYSCLLIQCYTVCG